jgi:hypothetical protein
VKLNAEYRQFSCPGASDLTKLTEIILFCLNYRDYGTGKLNPPPPCSWSHPLVVKKKTVWWTELIEERCLADLNTDLKVRAGPRLLPRYLPSWQLGTWARSSNPIETTRYATSQILPRTLKYAWELPLDTYRHGNSILKPGLLYPIKTTRYATSQILPWTLKYAWGLPLDTYPHGNSILEPDLWDLNETTRYATQRSCHGL